MRRLIESPFVLFLILGVVNLVAAQDAFGEVLQSNSHLWKTFQEEMKTLEEAAHRMNTLLIKSIHTRTPEDQEAKHSENSEELESEEKPIDDGVTADDELEQEEGTKKDESSSEESDSLLVSHTAAPHQEQKIQSSARKIYDSSRSSKNSLNFVIKNKAIFILEFNPDVLVDIIVNLVN